MSRRSGGSNAYGNRYSAIDNSDIDRNGYVHISTNAKTYTDSATGSYTAAASHAGASGRSWCQSPVQSIAKTAIVY